MEFRVLLENIRLNNLRNVIPLRIAAWSGEAELKLFAAKHFAGHSSLIVVPEDEGVYVNVRARRLDDVVGELKLGRVDFVKIDVEGAELEVLRGMRWILEHFKPGLVVEVRHANHDRL